MLDFQEQPPTRVLLNSMGRAVLYDILQKADKDPNLFYRATVEEEDTLNHHSMDIEQSVYYSAPNASGLTPDAFIAQVENKVFANHTGEENAVFRKGVFATATIKDLFADPLEVIYFTHKDVKWYGMSGGNRLKIIRGKALESREYLEDNEHIVIPETIEHVFAYSDALYGDILYYLDKTVKPGDWYINYFPESLPLGGNK